MPCCNSSWRAPARCPAPLRHCGTRDIARWQGEAGNVTIYRDNWGIAHVYGKTDADAVFGMEYAQAEDDFNRVESNYIDALGWHSQADGESSIYLDLRSRLFVDPLVLRRSMRKARHGSRSS